MALLAKDDPVSLLSPVLPEAAARPQSMEHYAQLPMAFEANHGQADDEVRFVSRGVGYSLFLTPTEAVFALAGSARRDADLPGPARGSGAARTSIVRMSIVGANPAAGIEGREPQSGRSHYLRGAQGQWQRNVVRYGKVHYDGVYPGIDLVYYGNQQQLEYDFVVEPGHDPDRIVLAFDGVESLRLDSAGNLVLGTATGDLVQNRPVIYQEVDGRRRRVEGGYRLLADSRVAFDVDAYDAGKPLVIDPVLAYGSYLGGSGSDAVVSLTTDAEGNVYVVGSTLSLDFPLARAGQTQNAGHHDGFVAKFTAHNNQLVYSTYLGGTGEDYAIGVAVDDAGNAFVAGTTESTDFPVHEALQPVHAGGANPEDTYLVKLTPAGDALEFGTYLGGTDSDWASAVDLDDAGNVYVAGGTCSVDFPTSTERAQAACDAFVAKLAGDGSAFAYSTYLGGDGYDMAYGLDVDGYGNAHVAGLTFSSEFPASSPKGGRDAFAAKLTADGNGLIYATRLGGSGADTGLDIVAQAYGGKAYIVGSTDPVSGAPASDFPTSPAAAQPAPGGGRDGFLVSLDESGIVAFSTFHGGSGADELREIALLGGSVYVAGFTTSTDLPLYAAQQRYSGGGTDAIAGRYLSSDGRRLWSTYLGGAGEDFGFAIGAHGYGNVYVAGSTTSSNLLTVDAQQPAPGAGEDGFLARFGFLGGASYRPDFDSDLGADVLWRNGASGANAVWKEADASQSYAIATVASQAWVVAGAGYFDENDWRADILWRNTSTGQNAIWLNGDPATPKAVATVSDLAWKIAAVADFDSDLQSDILWRNTRTGANVIWRSGNNATPQAVATVSDQAWTVAGTGDFDGDHYDDILWRHAVTGANAIWKRGSSTLPIAVASVASQDWKVAGVGDFLNDGRSDILWRNERTGANVIWRNAQSSSPQAVQGAATDWQVAAVGDYSMDGRSDIFWRNGRTGQNVIWKSANPALTKAVAAVPNLAWKVVD